jgi:hypothetical protein
MKNEDKVAIPLGVLAIGVPVAFGFGFTWPIWVVLVLIAVLLLVILAVRSYLAGKNVPPPPPMPEPIYIQQDPVMPPPPRMFSQSVPTVSMPSALPDYSFRFAATVSWMQKTNPDSLQHANLTGLAVNTIISRARQALATQQPADVELVRHQLAALLGAVVSDHGGQVEAWATDVSLTLSREDFERLTQLSNIRKNEIVWEHERIYERSKRTYLQSEALKDPGTALTWWMSRSERNDKEIEGVVELIGPLAQLSAAANNTEVSPLHRHLVPSAPGAENGHATELPLWESANGGTYQKTATELFADFAAGAGFDLDDADLALFAERAADALTASGRPATADEIRQRFNAPPEEPEPGDEVPVAGRHADESWTDANTGWPGGTEN